MRHLEIIRKKQAFETRKIIQSPEKTRPRLVSRGVLFFNLRDSSWLCSCFHQHVCGHLQDLTGAKITSKNPTFCIGDSMLTSSLEKDLLSCSHELRREIYTTRLDLEFLVSSFLFPPHRTSVFCFSEELVFCSLKSLLPVLSYGGGKVRRVGKIVAFPLERVQQSLMSHFYQPNEQRRWCGHRDQSRMFSLKFPAFDEQTCAK